MYTSQDSATFSVGRMLRRMFVRLDTRLLELAEGGGNDAFLATLGRRFALRLHGIIQVAASSELIVSVLSFVVAAAYHVDAYGWIEGIGLSVALLFHEAGHVIALWKRGYFVGREWRIPVYFIPFVGAVLRLWVRFRDGREGVDDEAFVGIMGPVAGGIATAIAFCFWSASADIIVDPDVRRSLFSVIATSHFFNLFNLVLTVRPFDGGRVAQAISPYFRAFGFIPLAALTYFYAEPWVVLLWIFALADVRMPNEWFRGGLFIAMSAGMAWWTNARGEWTAQDSFGLAIAAIAAFGAVLYASATMLPQSVAAFRALQIVRRRTGGKWTKRRDERRSTERGRRLGNGIIVPRPRRPAKKWGGVDRRKTTVLGRAFRVKWLVRYLVVFSALFALGSAIVGEFQ